MISGVISGCAKTTADIFQDIDHCPEKYDVKTSMFLNSMMFQNIYILMISGVRGCAETTNTKEIGGCIKGPKDFIQDTSGAITLKLLMISKEIMY